MPEINTAAHATHAHIREVYERCTRGIYERCTTGEVAWGREARGAQGVWGQGVGVAGTSRITGPTQGLEATVHTSNIHRMFVTLDVSNVEGSGWLNPFAICRVERKACAAGRCVRGRRVCRALWAGEGAQNVS